MSAKSAPPTAGIEVASVAVFVGLIIADEPFTVHSSPLRVQSLFARRMRVNANCRFFICAFGSNRRQFLPVSGRPLVGCNFFHARLSSTRDILGNSPLVWTFDFRHERRG